MRNETVTKLQSTAPNTYYQRRKSGFTLEKAGRRHLQGVVRVDIANEGEAGCVPPRQDAPRRQHSTYALPTKMHHRI